MVSPQFTLCATRGIMAKVMNGKQTVPQEEVVLAQAFEFEALLNVLERRGLVTRSEVLEEIGRGGETRLESRWGSFVA